MDHMSTPPADIAERACVRCKKNKRRCDKSLPSCSLCIRVQQPCSYGSETDSPQQEISSLRSEIRNLEQIVSQISSKSSAASVESPIGEASFSDDYHPVFYTQAAFLDTEMAKRLQPSTEYPSIAIPENLLYTLGDNAQIQGILSFYLQTIHPWMPIVSKINVNRMISSQLRPDGALLIVCMKLLSTNPTSSPRSTLYLATKQFAATLEAAGYLSLRSVQAGLLIAVYEMGHAIYPSAYTTIGLVARQGIALGIHNECALQLPRESIRWIDWEERLRVWWLILILDRFGTLGSEDRPLCTEDPRGNSYVPAYDNAWDEGQMLHPERVLVSSPKDVKISPFARMAQAANLVGHVIRHCESDEMRISLVVEQFRLLYQTTQSLCDVILSEAFESSANYSSLAICFSAILKLCSNHSCDSFSDKTDGSDAQMESLARTATAEALESLKNTATRVLQFALNIKQLAEEDLDSLSIFAPHSIYLCSVTLAWLASERNDESVLAGLSDCKAALDMMSQRWRVAGIYLKILSAIQNTINISLE